MVLSELQKIGFTTGEAKVYLALLKHGEQTKSTLACNADVSSSKVYEIAEKLIKKGIASSIIRNGKKFYQGSEPEHLNTYIKNKELELQNEKEIVKDIIPMISGEKKSRGTKVQIFEGWKGYEIALKEAINNMPFEATIKGIE
jgi:sugar-specific transcriptional regulator TrmB